MFITGIPQGGIDVGFTPILLGTTPRSLIGHVESVIETTMYGVSLISIALAGYFGQFTPVYIIYAIGGAFIALAGKLERGISMSDIRLQRMANVLVHYSLGIKKGDRLAIMTGPNATPLVREVVREAVNAGAYPETFVELPGVREIILWE